MVQDTKENATKCICATCPTKNQCMKDKMEWFFCARGKSACEGDRKGCFCGGCPVSRENKLKGMYYCFEGRAE